MTSKTDETSSQRFSDRQVVEEFAGVAVAMNHAITRQVDHIHQRCASDFTTPARCKVLRIARDAERIYVELTRKRLQQDQCSGCVPMTPTGGVDPLADVSRMKANVLVCAQTKVDPSCLIAGERVRHSEEKRGNLVNRMAGELQQIKRQDFVPKGRKDPLGVP